MTESAPAEPEDTVVAAPAEQDDPVLAPPFGPPLTVSPDGEVGRAPARVSSQMRRFDRSLLDLVQQQSTLQLFILWMGTILLSGLCFWLGARAGEHGLVEGGRPVGGDFNGFISAIYFSFVTATSIGYGDIVPVGFARVIACAEAVTALLIFGAVVAKVRLASLGSAGRRNPPGHIRRTAGPHPDQLARRDFGHDCDHGGERSARPAD